MEKNDPLKNSVELLLWTYFNLTFDDGKKASNVLNRCIEKAYFDATQQGAYNTQIPEDKKEASKAAKEKGIEILASKTNDLLTAKWDFDQWHKDICNALEHNYEELLSTYLFSYGNAQKWVNMTLKYVYTLYWLYHAFSPKCEFCVKYGALIDNYAHCFHIPVDSFMIEALWREKEIALPLKGKASRSKEYKNPSEYVKPWSKWSEQEYKDFQKSVRDHAETVLGKKNQLEWEGPEWIKIAQGRKTKTVN